MKAKDFETTLEVFKKLQEESPSSFIQSATIRKHSGGRGLNIRTLHILLSVPVRPRQKIPVYVWMKVVCARWNEALHEVATEAGGDIHNITPFVLKDDTVSVAVQGSTVKVTANILEEN